MNGAIERRPCGTTGLALPVLGIGCWAFGGGDYWGAQDQGAVDEVVRAAVEQGVNYFDTAEAYNDGRSEIALGIALQGVAREDVLIGSKISPVHCYPGVLERHCEDSLRRLRTDWIDLYMVHWPIHPHSIRHYTTDRRVIERPPDIREAFDALARLQDRGRIRHIGISNFSAGRMLGDLPAGLPVAANQLPYNLLCRAIEFDTMQACRERGIGIIGYMTLLQGVLTGKYPSLADVPPWLRRTRHFAAAGAPLSRHGEPGFEAETQAAIDAIRAIAADGGMTMGELATRWAIAEPAIRCALVGVRDIAQLSASLVAARGSLDADVIERLDRATATLKRRMGNHLDYYENVASDRTL